MSATAPPRAHTKRISTGSATTRATFEGFAKMPTPTMPPATTADASSNPSSRRKPVAANTVPTTINAEPAEIAEPAEHVDLCVFRGFCVFRVQRTGSCHWAVVGLGGGGIALAGSLGSVSSRIAS